MMDSGAMPVYEAVVLGIVQGITEFLPISSTAHLRVVPTLFGWGDPGAAYSAVIQLGSVIASVTYFWKDIVSITFGTLSGLQKKDLSDQNVRMSGAIIFGTIPVCVLGLLLKPLLEQDSSPLRSLMVVGCASIFMAIALATAERLGSHKRGIETIGGKDGLLVGLGQAMALIPGCSRSGSTLTVAMLLNLKRDEAARFSFLLGMPALVISGLVELIHMVKDGMSGAGVLDLAVGFVVSAVVSYAAIAWLLQYLKSHATWIFVAYRVIFGIAVIALTSQAIIK
ncbi:MAG TPA: undecaprenyl-diphosphate phosphatase [Oculatellaceae cyanobacterium]